MSFAGPGLSVNYFHDFGAHMLPVVLRIVEVMMVHEGPVGGEVVDNGVAKDGAQGGQVIGMEVLPTERWADNELQSGGVTLAKVAYFLEQIGRASCRERV